MQAVKSKPATIDDALAGLEPDQRKVLNALRTTIRKIAPNAVEGFSYGLPAFLVNGKAIAGFQATAKGFSYYPMSGRVIAKLAGDLAAFEMSKGAVQFSKAKPLPAALVRKLIVARIAELPPSKAKSALNPDVSDFLKTIDHPRMAELTALRKIMLAIDPEIRETVKWNAPNYRTTDDFATVNLRSAGAIQLILHTGAKTKATARTGLAIDDPTGLLTWLAKDRCLCTLGSGRTFQTNRKAFEAIIRQWISQLPAAQS